MKFVPHRMTVAGFAALVALMFIGAGLFGSNHTAIAQTPMTATTTVPSTSTATTTTTTTATTTSSVTATATSSSTATATATTATATPTTATATPTTPVATATTPAATATTPAAATQPANAPINLTLVGANEVPPVTTTATGKFLGTVGATSLSFTLTATAGASPFTMAHIHMGAAGTNGPIVAFLFGPVTAGVNGINVSGTITQANLIGPLAGNMSGFMAALAAGNLYVNAHTLANPGGEIRAQIPAAAKAPTVGTGVAPASDSNAALFFALAGIAGLVAAASGGSILLRRRS
jgi:hypothetical protein